MKHKNIKGKIYVSKSAYLGRVFKIGIKNETKKC